MARSYQDLLDQIETLKQQAEKVREAEVRGVIERIQTAITAYGITKEQLGFGAAARGRPGRKPAAKAPAAPVARKQRRGTGAKIAPKYRDEAGNTWTGRGLKPRWLSAAIASGRKLEDFAI